MPYWEILRKRRHSNSSRVVQIVIDCDDVTFHIFNKDMRQFRDKSGPGLFKTYKISVTVTKRAFLRELRSIIKYLEEEDDKQKSEREKKRTKDKEVSPRERILSRKTASKSSIK